MKTTSSTPAAEEPPVVRVRPEPVIPRRAARMAQLQRLMFAALFALLAGASLVWYCSRPGSATARPVAKRTPEAAEFRLPALDWAPVRPAAAAETTGPPPAPVAAATDEAGGLYTSAGVTRGSVAAVAPAPVEPRPSSRDSSPVLWRAQAQEVAPAARDPDGSRAEHGVLAAGYAPVRAIQLPSPTYVLPKGSSVSCALETAIESQLTGLVTCLTGAPVYGADGRVVLMSRGTRLLGETRSEARAGQSRVFVLWVEARTPEGALVPLASPATDALGRAGIPGQVDTHFFARFGAAMLISVLDAGVQAAAVRGGGGTVIVAPQTSEAVLTEVLRATVAIPPTISVPPGTLVSVLVARDVDFSMADTTSGRR